MFSGKWRTKPNIKTTKMASIESALPERSWDEHRAKTRRTQWPHVATQWARRSEWPTCRVGGCPYRQEREFVRGCCAHGRAIDQWSTHTPQFRMRRHPRDSCMVSHPPCASPLAPTSCEMSKFEIKLRGVLLTVSKHILLLIERKWRVSGARY